MAKTRGTGLLMLWTDVDAEHEAEFNRWYDEEHIERLLRVPGFLSASRYVAVKGGPKYLAMYELEEPGVLRTAAFLDGVRYTPSPWRQKASGGHVGRNYILNGYRQIFPARTYPIENTMEAPRWLQMGRMDIPAHMEEEFHAWYDTCLHPRIPGGGGLPPHPAVRRRRRSAEVPHGLRAGARAGARERGVAGAPDGGPVDQARSPPPPARRGLARPLPAHPSEVSRFG
jgi:hypothetical protein